MKFTVLDTNHSFQQIEALRNRTRDLLVACGEPHEEPTLQLQQVQSLLKDYVAGLRDLHSQCLSEGTAPATAGTGKYFLFRATQEALAWMVDYKTFTSTGQIAQNLTRAFSDIEWYIAQFPKRRET